MAPCGPSQANIADLTQALRLWSGRPGNKRRARLLWESRDAPWSELARQGHQLLRSAGIKGWRANHPVRIAGHTFYIDVAFPGAPIPLAVELDGWAYHGDPETMEADAQRHNYLQLGGWTVLRFTWRSLESMPEVVRRALARPAVCTGCAG